MYTRATIRRESWRPINFFPNGKTITLELHPTKNYNQNRVLGDILGERKNEYQELIGKNFAQLGNEIYGKVFQLKEDSDEYIAAKSRLDSLNEALLAFQYDHFLNDESILGLNEYVYLLQNASQMMISPEIFKPYQDFYLKKDFDHPLTERAFNLYTALSSAKVGQKYVDITLIDKGNTASKLSDFKEKKEYTLLDLWAPWCGPCIKKSLVWKDNFSSLPSNIQIIGVVGGVNEIAKAETAIDRFQYPWENYYEISDQNKIWEKYGIGNSGGAQFLIDSKGIILAINPELEELLNIINEK